MGTIYGDSKNFKCFHLQSDHPLFESVLVVDHSCYHRGDDDQHRVEVTLPQGIGGLHKPVKEQILERDTKPFHKCTEG